MNEVMEGEDEEVGLQFSQPEISPRDYAEIVRRKEEKKRQLEEEFREYQKMKKRKRDANKWKTVVPSAINDFYSRKPVVP